MRSARCEAEQRNVRPKEGTASGKVVNNTMSSRLRRCPERGPSNWLYSFRGVEREKIAAKPLHATGQV